MTAATSAPTTFDWRSLVRSKDAVLVVMLGLIIGMMIIPLPSAAIDLLVAGNLALSIGIMLLSMYIQRPMDFNVFPTVLLLLTLFRLGLNIAISRSLLLTGDAGKVISIFGNFVVGGNYVVGVVVFMMLMIIQFIVITNGSGRVAEVAARFTLDAMPGKQLSIDADLNAGIIDEAAARERRKQIQTEADFYGSMDGASKFVRGDATASIIIVLVNVIGGFVIGIVQRNLTLIQALQTYTLLTVGAGLVIQVSALLVSTATGMIVTRTASDVSLGSDVVEQLSNYRVLAVVTGITAVLGLIPGMPTLPFLGISVLLGGLTYTVWHVQQQAAKAAAAPPPAAPALEGPEEAINLLGVDPLELEIGYGLIPLVGEERAENLLRRVTAIRRQIAPELGIVLPKVRIRDNLRLQPQAYRIKVRGEEVAQGELMLDRYLAIPGTEAAGERIPGLPTTEPAFGLPAIWINEAEKGRAELLGYTVVDALTVLGTHLTEVVRSHAPSLLGKQEVQEMLDRQKRSAPATVEGLVPELLTLGEVQDVLRNLLRERVPIRDLGTILEVLANSARVTRDPDVLAEAARQALSRTLSNQFRAADNRVHVFTLSPQLEATLKASLGPADRGLGFQIDARTAQEIIARTGAQMETLAQAGHQPIILCPRELRLAFRRLVERTLPNLTVLAFSEISMGTQVQAHGLVELPTETRR